MDSKQEWSSFGIEEGTVEDEVTKYDQKITRE